MNWKTPLLAAATVGTMATASAASTLDFTIDEANSSVFIFLESNTCTFASCGVDAALADSFAPDDFSLAEGETEEFDFITFDAVGTGVTDSVGVVATLAFTTPDDLDTSAVGFGFAVEFFGNFVGGALTWFGVPSTVTLSDGSVVTVDFEDVAGLTFADTITISASVTVDEIAPIPLPGGAPLIAGGVMVLAATRLASKRRKAA